MAENTDARRMRLLARLAGAGQAVRLELLADEERCNLRTIRRDLDALQRLFETVRSVEVHRGFAAVCTAPYALGRFRNNLQIHTEAKRAIARVVAGMVPNDASIALTGGTTLLYVAQELRAAAIEGRPPTGCIVFTNSLPALHELVAAEIATGVLGEIYVAEDCALHSPSFHSAFQPSLAIAGVSGLTLNSEASTNALSLYSSRADEATFLRDLLSGVPEIIVPADSSKLNRRHPWSIYLPLADKKVTLVTESLTERQVAELQSVRQRLTSLRCDFQWRVPNSPQPHQIQPQ
ncbi:MAG: DeoR/GlpR transcriptional regulator [Armatimonadetes bacterium]|nr:DeoR/GlpR transcriptional regulator [Armatimonadota bacterium]MDE2207510.1 DeoR/GlpR transcriptional regulator [Armatimonadota bacterium]